MHKKFYKGIALLMGLPCLTGITAGAGYESPEQIAANLKAVSGGTIEEDGHKIYISPEDAQNGTDVHFGIWFETDVSLTDICVVSLAMECDTVEFVKSSYHSPNSYAYSEAQEFTHTDGNVYSSRFKPYCFGRINDLGNYDHASSFCMGNMQSNNFSLEWDHDYHYDADGNRTFSAAFFGDASDSYSFIEFDVNIPAETLRGIYPITFTNFDVASDASVPDPDNPGKYLGGLYTHITPMLYEAEIIVMGNPYLETDIQPVFRYAEDTQEFSVQDFSTEIGMYYNGDHFSTLTEDLLEVFETGSPAELSMNDEAFRILRSELTWNDMPVEDSQGNPAGLEYRIGRKGDVNMDGIVNAEDASVILKYAAANGAGQEAALTEDIHSTEEDFARFLGDIDGKGEEPSDLDATDASRILIYAAIEGTGRTPDWNEIS